MIGNRQNAWTESVRKALADEALEECRQRAREKERIQALGVDPNRLTPQRRAIIAYVKDEGAVTAKDVASKICKRNVRTASKHLHALEGLGVLKPIRFAEFVLSPLGAKIATAIDALTAGDGNGAK